MKKFLPVFISVFVIMMNVLSAHASGNILRGVDVKRGTDSYTIELTSSAPAKISKTIVSSNRILINLQNVNVSSNLSTRFNGSSVIDNVMVEPCGMNNVNVMVQGDNIAYSNIVFKEPSLIENTEDTIKDSFTSLFSILTGSSKTDKTVQYGTLLIFLCILFAEIRFIKSKYDELKSEKQQIIKDIERTKNFSDYLPGYGTAGIKKPYTTPVYGTAPSTVSTNKSVLRPLRTSESLTLNSLLSNRNTEKTLINKIVNNPPVFGSLSINENIPAGQSVSNPLERARLNKNIKYLEEMTRRYKSTATVNDFQNEHRTRLNRIY